MDREGIIRACVAEMWRYRLAVQHQLSRIRVANNAVLAEREQIEKDKEELLFGPSENEETFQERLEAIHYRDVPLTGSLKTEGQFLLVAVYGILSMARGVRRISRGDMNACVQRAISTFETTAPDADLLRHIHEHQDAYMRGEGQERHRLPDREFDGAIAMLDDGLAYFIAGKLFLLAEIAQAADDLAASVAECTKDVVLP
jgi:hypothetical protein